MTIKRKYHNLFNKLFRNQKSSHKKFRQSDLSYAKENLVDHYHSFIKSHPDIILILSSDGNVISQNEHSINRYLGYRAKEKIPYEKLISEEDYTALTNAFQKATKGSAERIYFKILNKKENIKHVVATFVPIQLATSTIDDIFVILTDITQNRQ